MATAKFEKLKIEIRVVPNPHSVNLIDMFITKAYPYLFETQECYILYNYGFDSVNPLEITTWKTNGITKEAHKRYECDENGFQSIKEVINSFRKLEDEMRRQYDLCDSLQKSIDAQN